jgi:Flp pilus assembly protein TadD
MHRRALAISAVAVLVVAALCLAFIRIQPGGFARVTRRGSTVSVAAHRIAWVAPFGSHPCLVPRQGERLLFQQPMQARLADEAVDLKINFAYEAPSALPADWPGGDWCASLAAVVARRVSTAASELTYERLLDDPRAAELRISTGLQRALAALNLKTSSVSARVQLPPGWERTRRVPDVASLAGNARPVLFIGLDGADWQLLDDYIAGGAMPNLARLVREGTSGFLETEHPPLSPIVWTTMMTGVSPLEHQILDFTHFNPTTGAKEPNASYERAVPAVWNMATMGGKSTAVFGLWATYPAEPVRGLVVSDRLFTFLFAESNPPPGIVFPPSREAWARAAVAEAEKSVDFATMHRFLPWIGEQEANDLANEADPYSKPGSALRRILIETEVYDRLSREYLAATMPDLTILYIQGTDSIGHVFAPLAPPKQPGVSDADYERYHQVPELYFRRIDQLLGEMIAVAERHHAVVMLASDHGFKWKEGRPVTLSSVATATAAKWHRNEGIYLLWGDGIARSNGHSGHGALRQVCATLLDLCALPRDTHAQGPPLGPARSAQTVDYRKWFERGAPPPAAPPATAASSNEELAKLRALGYIGSSESIAPRPSGVSSTKTAGAYNNAGLILKHENRIAEAIESFHQALRIDPNLASAAWNLSDLLFARNERVDEADELLLRALQNGLPEAPSYVIERAIKYQRSGHADRSLHLLEGAVARAGENPELRMFRGRYRIDAHDCAGALDDFQTAARLRPSDPIAFASAGLAQMCLGDRAGAQASFQRSLAIDPNQPMLRRYLQQ